MILALARATRRNRIFLPLAAIALPLLSGATALANLLALGRRAPPMFGAGSAVVLTLMAAPEAVTRITRATAPAAGAAPREAVLEGGAG
jgi:hypothetical protein